MNNSKMKIIAVAQEKGGVGKTTTTINVGAGLAKLGYKVLLIDLDSQCTLSKHLEYDGSGLTISDLIYCQVSGMPLSGEFIQQGFEKLSFIPAKKVLASIIGTLGSDKESDTVLKRLFQNPVFADYDYILIDCKPALDLLTKNALVACDSVLIPVEVGRYSYDAVAEIWDTILRVKATSNPKIVIEGYLITFYQTNTVTSRAYFEAMKQSYGDLVYDTCISQSVEVKESADYHHSVVINEKSKAGKQYMDIARTIAGGGQRG